MNRYINTFIWVIIIIGLGAIGYFAYTQLSNDFVYENTDTTNPVLVYNDENAVGDNVVDDTVVDTTTTPSSVVPVTTTTPTPTTTTTPPTTATIPEKYAALGAKIEKLITEYGGTMKVGSKGTRVGTVQEFLNIYNKTSDPVDNVYGEGTSAKIKAFQTAEKLASADGQAGPGTFKAMIEWLKKQS